MSAPNDIDKRKKPHIRGYQTGSEACIFLFAVYMSANGVRLESLPELVKSVHPLGRIVCHPWKSTHLDVALAEAHHPTPSERKLDTRFQLFLAHVCMRASSRQAASAGIGTCDSHFHGLSAEKKTPARSLAHKSCQSPQRAAGRRR